MARSISSITVRRSAVASSAPKRCSRSVSLRALTSTMTSPMASSLRASRARMEKSSSRRAARRLERVCREKVTRCFTESAKPSQKMTIKKVSVQAVPRKNFRSTEESGQPATPEGQRPALGVGSGAHTLVGSFQSMLLQPAVHGATAQSESFGGLADISFVTRKSTLNEILLDFVETHLLQLCNAAGGLRAQAEIGRTHCGSG